MVAANYFIALLILITGILHLLFQNFILDGEWIESIQKCPDSTALQYLPDGIGSLFWIAHLFCNSFQSAAWQENLYIRIRQNIQIPLAL